MPGPSVSPDLRSLMFCFDNGYRCLDLYDDTAHGVEELGMMAVTMADSMEMVAL